MLQEQKLLVLLKPKAKLSKDHATAQLVMHKNFQ
jgi:hypothetical protein